MKKDELLNCPFCGEEEVLFYSKKHERIMCGYCSAMGGFANTEKGAVEEWNIRHESEQIKVMREALEEVSNVLYVDCDGIGDLNYARALLSEALSKIKEVE